MNVRRLPPSNPELPCFFVELSTGSMMLMNLDDEVMYEYHPDFGTSVREIESAPSDGKVRVTVINATPDELRGLMKAWEEYAGSGARDRPPLPPVFLTDAEGNVCIAKWSSKD